MQASEFPETLVEQAVNTLNPWFMFALAALATWRITHLVVDEDGPFDSILKLRSSLGRSTLGDLMDCFECVSLLIAIPLAFSVIRSPLGWMLAWLALSGAACLLQRLGAGPVGFPLQPPSFPDNHDRILRRPRQDHPEI